MFLKPFIKKFTGNLNTERVFSDFERDDGLKPGLVGLLLDIILDKHQAVIPNFFSRSLHPGY
jgi:hypothetical protein